MIREPREETEMTSYCTCKSYRVYISCKQKGIQIRSHLVIPDNSKAVWTIYCQITPKVVLWMSKVLLNHNIFSEFSYDVVMYDSMYLSSDPPLLLHLELSQSKIDTTNTTIAWNNVFAEGCSSLRLKSVKNHKILANHARAPKCCLGKCIIRFTCPADDFDKKWIWVLVNTPSEHFGF